MKILINTLTVWVLLFVVVSCTQNENSSLSPKDPSEVSYELIPLKIGNYWHWKTTLYDEYGNEQSTFDYRVSIGADTLINQDKWFIPSGTDDCSLNSNKTGGYFVCCCGHSQYTCTSNLKYKFPGNVGDKWQFNNYVYRINNTDTLYHTGLRQYSCYEYIKTNENWGDIFYEKTFISPGIGEIAIEGYETNNTNNDFYMSFKTVLIDYRIK